MEKMKDLIWHTYVDGGELLDHVNHHRKTASLEQDCMVDFLAEIKSEWAKSTTPTIRPPCLVEHTVT